MLEYRERNRNKHIISDNEVNAFAWAGYYANYSTILVNPQYITNALQEAIRLKKATNIYVYKKEKNILFYKLAAPKK